MFNKVLIYLPSINIQVHLLFSFIEVQLIYIILVSGVQHSDSKFLQIILHLFFINLFIYLFGCIGSSLLFSSCSERGLLFTVVCRPLIAVASLVAKHRLQVRGLHQLWHAGSVVMARRLQRASSGVVAQGLSCSAACGIFPDQGLNPCPLHWQVDF